MYVYSCLLRCKMTDNSSGYDIFFFKFKFRIHCEMESLMSVQPQLDDLYVCKDEDFTKKQNKLKQKQAERDGNEILFFILLPENN